MIFKFKRALSQWLLRKKLFKRGVKIADNALVLGVEFKGSAEVSEYTRIIGAPKIIIGDNFYVNVGCHFLGDIEIGADVAIGPKVVFWGRDHGIKLGETMRAQGHSDAKIFVGDDVWIGANVTVLKGVSLSSGCVVGAGSVVTKYVPPNAIVAGNPAKIVKYRS